MDAASGGLPVGVQPRRACHLNAVPWRVEIMDTPVRRIWRAEMTLISKRISSNDFRENVPINIEG